MEAAKVLHPVAFIMVLCEAYSIQLEALKVYGNMCCSLHIGTE